MTHYSREVIEEVNPQDVYRKVIKAQGELAQCRQAMEECAELIHAINKVLRNGTEDSVAHLVDEVADVMIMIEQLRIIFDLSYKDLQKAKMKKVARLALRLGIREE